MDGPLVKICGMTSREDACFAVDAGADFLGFIFVPQSPRYVTIDQVASIVRQVRGRVRTVGVFQDVPAAVILATVEACGLDIIQLHGYEPPAMARQLGVERVWKAVSLRAVQDVELACAYPAAAVLADTMVGAQRGGTGMTGNWQLAFELARQRATVLAGGLNPENVTEAVQRVKPFAVDVSSGVETKPGRKDPEKVMRFVAAVRAAQAKRRIDNDGQ